MSFERTVEGFAKLRPGWNGERARAISATAIKQALSFQAVPTNVGGVQIELHRLGDDLEIEIGPDGRLVSVSWERAR